MLCLLQVSASDGDADANQADIRYSLEGTGTGTEFTIDSMTGQITLDARLDREKRNSWKFLVKATDDVGRGLTGYADVVVTVTDINDNNPYFPELEYRGSVPENAAAGKYILLHIAVMNSV